MVYIKRKRQVHYGNVSSSAIPLRGHQVRRMTSMRPSAARNVLRRFVRSGWIKHAQYRPRGPGYYRAKKRFARSTGKIPARGKKYIRSKSVFRK